MLKIPSTRFSAYDAVNSQVQASNKAKQRWNLFRYCMEDFSIG